MNNLFGKLLRTHMANARIKESELAAELSYDATYISKWINGSKLPSQRNADEIIIQIVDFFVKHIYGNMEEDVDNIRQEWVSELKTAYDNDCRYLTFQSYNNNHMSFLNNHKDLVSLTREALIQSLIIGDGHIQITATMDLFRLYGKEFKRLMQEIYERGVKKVEIKLAINPDILNKEYYFYAENILSTIGNLGYIEMSIVCQKPEGPRILVINELLSLQILWNSIGELAVAFSMENAIVRYFKYMCEQIIEGSKKLLDPAEPEQLKRTNVQVDSYSDRRQWLFFNEPPALLFPKDIMDYFIKNAKDENYASHLLRLKNTFEKYTCKSKIDLIIVSSILNKYLSDGRISIGNVDHQLNEEQRHSHIKYLSKLMRENLEFNIYLIRDTVLLSEEICKSPSIFLDTYSLYIENSKKNSNDNFHISMDHRMRDGFQRVFENILEQHYCSKLTAEDILRYL